MIDTIAKLTAAQNSGNLERVLISKGQINGTGSGTYNSTWLVGTIPAAGSVPTSAAVLNNTTTGAIVLSEVTSPIKRYISNFEGFATSGVSSVEIYDRLMHMGGLVGNTTSTQTVSGMDLSSNLAVSNLSERIGKADYSDVQWWLECYTSVGGTASVATVNVTYDDGSTGDLNTFNFQSTPAGRVIPLNNLIPGSSAGRYIRAINSITLSTSTGTAGNFGFTATRYRCSANYISTNRVKRNDWFYTGLPEVYAQSCLTIINRCGTTSAAPIRYQMKVIKG